MVVKVVPSTVPQCCAYPCRCEHLGDAQEALLGVCRGHGQAAELAPSGDHRLHILERSAQFRRACFLDKLVYLVRRHASDGLSHAGVLVVAVDGLAHFLVLTRRGSTTGGET